MYEVIALCICTSCLSCICCFVTGALCVIPKLLQIRKDLDGGRVKKSSDAPATNKTINERVIKEISNKNGKCHDPNNYRKETCKCPKKIIIHTLPIAEEAATCGLRRREGCTCNPLRIDENSEWQ